MPLFGVAIHVHVSSFEYQKPVLNLLDIQRLSLSCIVLRQTAKNLFSDSPLGRRFCVNGAYYIIMLSIGLDGDMDTSGAVGLWALSERATRNQRRSFSSPCTLLCLQNGCLVQKSSMLLHVRCAYCQSYRRGLFGHHWKGQYRYHEPTPRYFHACRTNYFRWAVWLLLPLRPTE